MNEIQLINFVKKITISSKEVVIKKVRFL
jgi:hypothetical protein